MPWFTNKGQVLQLGAAVIFGSFAVAIGLFGGAAVLAASVGIALKVMGLSPDWWVLLLVFFGGLLLMRWSQGLVNNGSLGRRVEATSLPLKPNEIIYPRSAKNGVLWEWDPAAVEMRGPLCPTHRVRLLYWPNHYGMKRAEFKEEDVLIGAGSVVCPRDDEDFVFIREGIQRIRELRAQALAQFQVEQEYRKKHAGE